MREKVEISFWNWFNKTAVIYMVIILIGSAWGGNISRRSIWGIGLISGVIPLLECTISSQLFKGIPHYLKSAIHYIECFFIYIIISWLIKINDFSMWSIKDWLIIILIYTIIYWGFNYFYRLKHESEVKHLNEQLDKFKEKFSED